ncbi:hypothetical protein Agub_g10904 [Astrephomene gubernaculifera]|uniref:Damage-control phosphatase ARMT1-like metal-binding domain-containing protein n=1 Tax=Astrephomene gubernaculifera TaxID=47775 RepID=A0AAD3DWE2_9CHLO|nr:hypothetical protein Agub_g10904 [Astrephomene gubernaculifera]
MSLHLGVLHYSPTLEPFPLLADPAGYEPNTLNITGDEEELRWWVGVLREQVPTVVEKAAASEGGGEAAQRRAQAFGRAFSAHLDRMTSEPGSYGALGLGELFGMREECLREFGFEDVYRLEKERENRAALAVLPDLLRELDSEPLPARLLSLVEGVLAANIFDWGSQACVALYRDGTILDIYRSARLKLAKRPWARDNFDAFAARILEAVGGAEAAGRAPTRPPFRRVMMFIDNSGADAVLGMLPFARELLRMGCEVVLVANSLPAINDITAPELRALLGQVAELCPIIRAAREAAVRVEHATGGHVPPYPGLTPARRTSSALPPSSGGAGTPTGRRSFAVEPPLSQQLQLQQPQPSAAAAAAAAAAAGAGEGAGAGPSSTAAWTASSSTSSMQRKPSTSPFAAAAASPVPSPDPTAPASSHPPAAALPIPAGRPSAHSYPHLPPTTSEGAGTPPPPPAWHAAASDPAVNAPGPKLYVVANGQGSPCLDLRRVPDRLAEACVGVDLLVIEGMGRAIHTNLHATFTCDVLKLAMIKTERLARKLFGGGLYDCICVYATAEEQQQ